MAPPMVLPPWYCGMLAGGYSYAAGLNKTGQVWGWGYNDKGQIGNNALLNKGTPVSILGTKKTFCQISTEYKHSSSINNRGLAWGWGYNSIGQLGDNSVTSKRTPVSVLGGLKTFCEINSGYLFNLAIDYTGLVWSWGTNNLGQLSINSLVSKCTPTSILGARKTFCKISAGQDHSLAIHYDYNIVFAWGSNNRGQLGINSTVCKSTPIVIHLNDNYYSKIATGIYYSAALDFNGLLWTWGDNTYGQLGINSVLGKCIPTSILGNKKTFCEISGGYYHMNAIDFRGQVWGWGRNDTGQLGNMTYIYKSTPVSILGTKKTFCSITSGDNFTLAIEKNGNAWGWGRNNKGQLGNAAILAYSTPITILSNKTFCAISGNTIAGLSSIDYTGQIWKWGDNTYGQLGINSTVCTSTPVSILGAKKTFCSIDAATYITVALDKNGIVWCWGYGFSGRLGINSTICRSTPVSIMGARKTFCRIACGGIFNLTIDKNGRVWAWGDGGSYNLGYGSTANKSTPVSIVGANKTFCQIAAGYTTGSSSLAIDKNGLIWGWGFNYQAQLGQYTNVQTVITPTSIMGGKKTFCSVKTSGEHSIGLSYNGTAWGWGYQRYGGLGNGSTSFGAVCTPISVMGAKKTFCKISVATYLSSAIDFRGQVWTWGYNIYGQLGNNTSGICVGTPVSILGAKKTFCSIHATNTFVMAIDNHSKLWGWGYSSDYELTTGVTQLTPVRIYNLF
jgi:alpha-tubulin suppressor-like RCC1 family protein